MNDPSSEQRPAMSSLLTPIDSTLKELWFQERTTEFPFNEFRLNGIPESLKTFVNEFLKEDGTYDQQKLLIWTSENSFVHVGYHFHGLPGVYRDYRFRLVLTSGSNNPHFYIHSTTLKDAMSCLDFLAGLHDDHFDEMSLFHQHEAERGPLICPLTSVLLEKVLQQNAKRKSSFYSTTFTPDQSRTLATSGTRTDIELNSCKLQDDGAAFLEALAARVDPQIGLAKLRIEESLPFAEGIMVLFLHILKFKCLTLKYIHLESEEACRAVAEAELQYLNLDHCELGDGGASLVESITEGRGPKGLGLHKWDDDEDDWNPFDSQERFIFFLNALRGNTYLERLDLSRFDLREEGIHAALAAALFENKGLVQLGLQNCHFDESGFCKVLRALSAHPSLRTLDLTGIELDMDGTKATEEVAKTLSDNVQLEVILIDEDDDDSPFDSLAWDKLVIPRLEYNIYRKRFPPIQNIRSPSTRAAVMASALAHVSNRPSPAYMLLRQNGDILSSYPRVEEPQIATSSRKRSHSPSSDGMVVSNLRP
jgi:hypothetical protein